VATLTFVYSDSTAVIGPLATAREPHSWDLCISHAGRITAPRGWELVRHAGPLAAPPPDEDDLVAIADAVREGSDGAVAGAPAAGFVPETDDDVAPSAAGASDSSPANTVSDAAGGSHQTQPGGHHPEARAGVAGSGFGGGSSSSGRRPASSGRRRGHLRVLPDPAD
jgi:hypothetical protein